MKRFPLGVIVGLLIGVFLATATIAVAAPNAIKLIVNGQDVCPDVPPQMIDGRVMVPARFVAEPLGAQVEWDAVANAVIITNKLQEVDTVMLRSTIAPGEPKRTDLNNWWPPLQELHVKGVTIKSLSHHTPNVHCYWTDGDDLIISTSLASKILDSKGYGLVGDGRIFAFKPCGELGEHVFVGNWTLLPAPNPQNAPFEFINRADGVSIAELTATGLVSLSWDAASRTLYVD